MNRKSWIVFAIWIIGAFGCATDPGRTTVPQGAEMLFWEWQSWETDGGRNRLTIWKDGRSQIVVVPDAYTRGHPERFRPRQGWTMVEKPSPHYSRTGVFVNNAPAGAGSAAPAGFDRPLPRAAQG